MKDHKLTRYRVSDEAMIVALKRTRGLVYLAAQGLQCDPATIHRRAQKRPKIRAVIEDERNRVIDFAEAKLIESVGRGEAWAVCFLLKTQGRKRGYNERWEMEELRKELESIRNEFFRYVARGPGYTGEAESNILPSTGQPG